MKIIDGDCKKAIEIIENKSFEIWAGLPDNCKLDDLLPLFKSYSDSIGTGKIGANHEKCSYKMATLNSFNQQLRVWFKGKDIVKIDIKYPKIETKLFNQLGNPDGKLDFFLQNFKMTNAEWVYASKGISVIQNSDCTQIIEIVLFKPMSFEQYQNNIYYRAEIREF